MIVGGNGTVKPGMTKILVTTVYAVAIPLFHHVHLLVIIHFGIGIHAIPVPVNLPVNFVPSWCVTPRLLLTKVYSRGEFATVGLAGSLAW
jgi:hypothetical protein